MLAFVEERSRVHCGRRLFDHSSENPDDLLGASFDQSALSGPNMYFSK